MRNRWKKAVAWAAAVCVAGTLLPGTVRASSVTEQSLQTLDMEQSIAEESSAELASELPEENTSAQDAEVESQALEDPSVEEESAPQQEADIQMTSQDEELSAEYSGEGILLEAAAPVTGTFDAVSGYDIASVRYYTNAEKSAYAFAEVTYNSTTKKYEYSFQNPYSGFAVSQASEYVRGAQANASATVIAEYFNTAVWDGAVDLSWYNETAAEFHLSTPAQLAGLAAIVNGSTDVSCKDYMIKGDRSFIANRENKAGSLPAGGTAVVHEGLAAHDFSDKTIYLDADMDMGGTDGANINHTGHNDSANQYDYPNWTPIGGEYLMDVSDLSTMTQAHFNGTLDGSGHHIKNIYCYRWAYPHAGVNAYAYAQGTGFIGMMGVLYDGEENPKTAPAVRNLSVSGYIFGRRMVGGVVGAIGGGSNAVSGNSVKGEICVENVANHAYVYNTDSKGIGGIVGCSMAAGSVINCYNDGRISTIYANPAGGIIGANEHMDIYCCYNRGDVKTGTIHFGRGIGGTGNSPGGFTVDNCYYLNGCGDDPNYPGYYTYNLPASCSVTTTGMTKSDMTGGKLLSLLNVNGTAYVTGDSGYPVLYWEKSSGIGSLTVQTPQGGTVTATRTGALANGTVVYLSNTADTGYNFRYYTKNEEALTGDYVTVNGSTTVSAYLESAKAGVLRLPSNAVCDIAVRKTGYISVNGELTAVSDYPVAAGDELFEGDVITVTASLKKDVIPEDPDMDYKAAAGLPNAYQYAFTYTGSDPVSQANPNFTVGSEIAGEGVTLSVEVTALTTPKLWSKLADTSWYKGSQTTFTLTTAAQLAGLDVLVEGGNDFSGKTILLGKDISLKNTDGTTGIRSWDGIGNAGTTGYFAGTFDGQGHKITDLHGVERGLFAQCIGTGSSPAVIKNVTVYGTTQGAKASGIVADGKYTTLSGCSSYVVISGGTSYVGGILAKDNGGCSLESCINYASVAGTGYVGGITGSISSTGSAENVINYGDITVNSTANNQVGGVAGICDGTLRRGANYGAVTASGRNIGGVVGRTTGASLTDCYNAGTVTYQNGTNSADALGGLIGYGLTFTMANCFDYGTVIRESGTMTGYIGSAVGRDSRNSKNGFTNVFVRKDANAAGYVCLSKTLTTLMSDNSSYYAGISEKSEAAFADAADVLKAINTNSSFALAGKPYPELKMAAQAHVHSGGTATCSEQAVCEVCGLSYGALNPENHPASEIRNQKDAVWIYDGYSGDEYCTACGSQISTGKAIAADKTAQALTVIVKKPDGTETKKTYTKAEFDKLKTNGAIAYSYGAESKSIMAATEYVTMEDLFGTVSVSMEDVEDITVVCTSSTSVITQEELTTCNQYYDAKGQAYVAPAAIAISYHSMSGTLEEVAAVAQPSDDLRFGFGISKKQYDEKTAVGGKRLVSPVQTITIRLKENGHLKGDANMDGQLTAADVTCIARHAAGMESITDEMALRNADTDGDGEITEKDASHLSEYLAHIISGL